MIEVRHKDFRTPLLRVSTKCEKDSSVANTTHVNVMETSYIDPEAMAFRGFF